MGASSRSCPNRQSPVDQSQAFTHASEAQSTLAPCRGEIEADTVIVQPQLNSIPFARESDLDLPSPSIFQDIMEGFLRNAIQTEGDIAGDHLGHVLIGKDDPRTAMF